MRPKCVINRLEAIGFLGSRIHLRKGTSHATPEKKLRAPPPKAGGSWNDLDATDEHDETEAANVLREFFSPKVNSCKCASVRGLDRVAC